MKVVVIGAASHIGNAITRALVGQRHEVTACGRRKELPVNLVGLPVQYSVGEGEAPGQFDRWSQHHEIVVDAAAPYPLDVFSIVAERRGDPVLDAERRTRRLLDAVS